MDHAKVCFKVLFFFVLMQVSIAAQDVEIHNEGAAEFRARMQLAKQISNLRGLLDMRLSRKEIEALAGIEFAPSQAEEFDQLTKDYAKKLADLKPDDHSGKTSLKMELVKKLNEILLPEQLEALGQDHIGFSNVLVFMTSKPGVELLKLTESQKRKILQKQQQLDKELQRAIKEHYEMLERERARVLTVFDELTDEQRLLLERITGRKPQEILSQANLAYLRQIVPTQEKE